MLCYRCGGHVKDGSEKCTSCGQAFEAGQKTGPAAGFGTGMRRPRNLEGAPYQTGEVVAGRYQVRDHVSAGPLGWMYRGLEVSTDGEVALKVLSPRFLQTPEERRLFVAELHKAQRLAHPNLVRVYEAGDDAGRPFIASQHLEGLTLRRIMDLRRARGQRFSLEEIEPIVAQIAAGLEAAASAFAHGNLKPDNVIVLPDLLKLTDFGLAVSLPRGPFLAAQKAGGVHRYLPPEFLLAERLDARTDVFSLGVLLGELLSGGPALPGDAQLSLLEKTEGLPLAVQALYRRAVSARPEQRFASASELSAELSLLVSRSPRAAPLPRSLGEDAGDVLIVEAYTDPRLRIARALAVEPAKEAPARAPAAASALDPAAIASLGSIPLPVSVPPAPFNPPPPYEPPAARASSSAPKEAPAPASAQLPASEKPASLGGQPAAVDARPLPSPAQPPPALAADESDLETAPAVAVRGPLTTLEEVARSVGATPELLTAETAVRTAPARPEAAAAGPDASAPPEAGVRRRGAGKRPGKEKHAPKGRGRRSQPPDASGSEDPVWAMPVATESQPDFPAHAGSAPTPAPAADPSAPEQRAVSSVPEQRAAPVESAPPAPVAAEPAGRRPRSPRSSPPSFAALEQKRSSRAPLYAMALVGLVVLIGGSWSVLSSREPAPETNAESADKTAPAAAGGAATPAAPAATAAAPASPAVVPTSTAGAGAPAASPAVHAEAAKTPAPAGPSPAPKAPAKALVAAAEPPRARTDERRSLRDSIRSVTERAKKALAERRQKREEALATAAARRSKESAAPAVASASIAPAATLATPASATSAAVSGQPAPGGAIRGVGDEDLLAARSTPPRAVVLPAAATAGQAVALAVPASAQDHRCPPGMQKVPGGQARVGSDASDDLRNFGDRTLSTVDLKPYCMDQYEFPNQPGKLPKVAAAFTEADALCKNAGKRLCSEDEWEKACKGPDQLRFPYGAAFDADACNTQDKKDAARQTNVAGAFSRCKSGYGVFDLSGNAAEWTGSAFEGSGPERAVKGGSAARPGFDDRCASRRKLAPGAHDVRVGFRCCADAR